MTLSTTQAIAWISVGEQVIPIVIKDVDAFKAWLVGNSDAADTTQLQANDTAFAAAIAEEQAKQPPPGAPPPAAV